MPNTSATGGYLALTSVAPLSIIEDALHDLIAGITGLQGSLIRPRWQPEPPRQPKPSETWCAFGIMDHAVSNFPEVRHVGAGDGSDEIITQSRLTVMVAFYGPEGDATTLLLRDGLHVAQNRAGLRAMGLAFESAGDVTRNPELVGNRWLPRSDMTIFFRRETRRTVATLNLQHCGCGILETDCDLSVPLGGGCAE
ncbi:phage neck terminator protein [Desulfovibrio psychrotolerans]|uniref:Phage neck terminator protein gp12-like domain-containing protein n=1 Tax=Desulfovibrio psychrotolerans TaxID=415242 RepID=A0A7J0BWA6_9BACT|nr:hypothetical protein [Desulfovibrio psychrotolerans]GFM37999.1 hypothetical protein DSM19430T_26830 [Desulfovibrio psychrotolerans]